MNLHRLILLGLLFSTGLLNAQTDFRSGYIIKNSGDTLYGKIDYRGDLLMSNICKFKDVDNVTIEYNPNDIKAFRFIDSKYFVSKEINGKNVFLEYLLKGKVDIYYIRDKKGDHYYLDKENQQLTELPYEEGIRYVDDKPTYFKTTKHNGILNYFMQDAPGLKSRIESLKEPEHKSLIKLAEDYNNAVCEGEQCIIYEKRLPLIKISVTPFLGLSKYNGYDKFNMELGGYLSLWAPRASEKLFFKTGISYQKLSDDEEDLNIFKIPVQFQYIFRAHRLQPNISAGVNLLSLQHGGYVGHSLSLSAGLDYKISDNKYLTTAFNSDFTPMIMAIMDELMKFDILSYSIIVGLRIDL